MPESTASLPVRPRVVTATIPCPPRSAARASFGGAFHVVDHYFMNGRGEVDLAGVGAAQIITQLAVVTLRLLLCHP
jgi:hypothetical protein